MLPDTSPWHAGERAMHASIGEAARMLAVGANVIRDYMPEQHRAFFAKLPFMLVGSVDAHGMPWASVLAGAPGFATTPDERSLRLQAQVHPDDPLAANLAPGAPLGLLGIELHTRRRNRANGHVLAGPSGQIDIALEHSFGNCPRYISLREPLVAHIAAPGPVERSSGLDAATQRSMRRADTIFIATNAGAQVDVSHRGGPPGFIRVDGDTLTVPDFAGNHFFNTMGNIASTGRAGLLWIDFDTGELLQLSGSAELVLEGAEIARFRGAERLWRLHVKHAVRRPAALGLRGSFNAASPQHQGLGPWLDA